MERAPAVEGLPGRIEATDPGRARFEALFVEGRDLHGAGVDAFEHDRALLTAQVADP